jgi:hypothetical protein
VFRSSRVIIVGVYTADNDPDHKFYEHHAVNPLKGRKLQLTLFETPEGDLWVLEIDLAHESHVRKVLDHLTLSRFGDGMVVTVHEELERCVRDVFLPQVPRGGSIVFVQLFVRATPSVQLVDRPSKDNQSRHQLAALYALSGHLLDQYASSCKQSYMFLLFQNKNTERSRRVKVVFYV